MKIIAVINQKGGVGKTTTTANLGYALALQNLPITLIDLDPQAHLAVALGFVKPQRGIDAVMLGEAAVPDVCCIARERLQLITSGTRLQQIEQLTAGGAHRGDLLRRALQHPALQQQAYVLIDCPPSSGLLVANALFAADQVLIPMTSDFLALQGLSYLMATLHKFEKALQRQYRKRLVLSRYNASRRLSQDVLAMLQRYFPRQIFATLIHETAVLAECPSFGKTIFEYRPQSRSARDFRSLARDFLQDQVM